MIECFVCGKEIEEYPCPYCLYDEDDLTDILSRCPNLNGDVCIITENTCYANGNFMECRVKMDAEKESCF